MKMGKKLLTGITSSIFVATAVAEKTWTIDTQEEWEKNLNAQEQLELKDGMASPTAEKSTFQSKLKRFPEKHSAKLISFGQSPVWLNWESTPNIGTTSMSDAPVFLSLGPDNYWMFARYSKSNKTKKSKKSKKAKQKNKAEALLPFEAKEAKLEGFNIPLLTTRDPNEFTAPGGLKEHKGGYHAWQSRDMKNWVHHGSITEKASKWMTTAEFVDGKAYFYYDFPNDQDPHLYIDEDLTDGLPGKNMGMAFKDPSHGSDCAFIRDLEGNFHVIYENWNPINAKKNAWDSPLAGHAVSPDGINDFKILTPAVDERTTPTGKTGTYTHPHWAKEDPDNYKTNVAEYQIHSPDQNAYGDWASISIGGQYYLFGDFDPAGKHEMSVAMFTSSSLDKPFTFFNNVGKGHPDPDVCFAEGCFYLATQQSSDFTSPGPWVETVEVRVGVDTTNDAKVDKWSDWQTVKESYDHTPGFAKQIKRIPASMDLSKLPAGYGFQFEVRLIDTTENKSKPVLDKVELTFSK